MALPALSDASAVVAHTKKISDQIRTDYLALKELYQQLQKDHNDQTEVLAVTRAAAEQSRKAKDELDRELHGLYQQWDTDIKTQSAHFASLQATMIPARELELMRVQMADEMEAPHRQRIDQLIEEINRYRELYAREHTELELLRTRHDASIADHKQTVIDLGHQSSLAVTALQTKCAQLQQLVTELETSHADGVRKLTRENHDLHMRVKVCSEENVDLRHRAEAAIVEREQSAIVIEKERADTAARRAVLEKECGMWKVKCDTVQAEWDGASKQVLNLQRRILGLEQAKNGLEETVAQKEKERQHSIDMSDRRVQEFQQRMESERQRQQLIIEQLQTEVATLNRARESGVSALAAAERDCTVQIKLVREEEMKKLIACEKAKSGVESELLAERRARADLETHATHQLTHCQQKIATLTDSIEALTRERDAAAERANGAANQIKAWTESYGSSTRDSDEWRSEKTKFQAELKAYAEREHALSLNAEKWKAEADSAQREIQSLTHEIDAERKSYANNSNLRKDGWIAERAQLRTLLVRMEGDLTTKQNAWTSLATQLKADKLKYKKMSQLLQLKLANTQRELESSNRQHSAELESKRFQLDTVTRQLHELERTAIPARPAGLTGSAVSVASTAARTVLDDELTSAAELATMRHHLQLQQLEASAGDRKS